MQKCGVRKKTGCNQIPYPVIPYIKKEKRKAMPNRKSEFKTVEEEAEARQGGRDTGHGVQAYASYDIERYIKNKGSEAKGQRKA